MAEFITIEPSFNEEEKSIWEAFKTVFSQREAIGYVSYPLFIPISKSNCYPDILICDRSLGVIIIQIISKPIESIISVNQEELKIENNLINYLELGHKFSQILKNYLDKQEIITNQITIRPILIFSQINTDNWQNKNFIGLEEISNFIFNNQLNPKSLIEKIEKIAPTFYGISLENEQQWHNLLNVISGNIILKNKLSSRIADNKNLSPRRQALIQVQQQLYNWDVTQEWIGKSIPNGMQRIRGIAGSGKTVLLCQKAALMHLKHPEWQIALVFFTRSLYQQIIELISLWVEYFSNGEIKYNPEYSNLKVLHGWGGKRRQGLYSYICQAHQYKAGTPNQAKSRHPQKGLAKLCGELLNKITIKPLFDAILIDEGQDFVTKEELKFKDKQAIYWLAYCSLKSIDSDKPKQKRLIWAFDEAQNLSNMIVPETKEIFGENLSQLLGGESGGIYLGGARKSYDMRRCFRTPAPILNLAYGIGFGFYRGENFKKTQRMRKTDWENIGYEVEGDFRTVNTPIKITRPEINSPNPLPQIWQDSLINFSVYNSRKEELMALVEKVQNNLTTDQLQPQEILIIALGDNLSNDHNSQNLQLEIANFLLEQGINIYIPSALQVNQTQPQYPNHNPDLFWDQHNRGVTITTIERAKGNEAEMVYLVGLDHLAYNDNKISYRNQLFVGITRSKAWLDLSGIGKFPLYEEIQKVIDCHGEFTFTLSSR